MQTDSFVNRPADVPPRQLTTDPEKTIFVGRLNHATTEGDTDDMRILLKSD